jgi:hypothetical protein
MPVPLSRTTTKTAVALPDPWPVLAHSRYAPKWGRGEIVMLAGPSGAGKTILALDAVIRMRVPALYFSADSNHETMQLRAAANLSGHPTADIRAMRDMGLFAEEYAPYLSRLPVRFQFEPSDPSVEDIALAMEAYQDIEGGFPQILVIDNLTNIAGEEDNEWSGLRSTIKELHWLARKTGTCILVLHHTSETDPKWLISPAPKNAIKGKITEYPSTILTVVYSGGLVRMAVVKNRHGESDPLAKDPIMLSADFSRCRVWGK